MLTLRWSLVSSVGTCALVGSSEADHSTRELIDMVDVGRREGDVEREKAGAGVIYEAGAELKGTMMVR